MHAIETAPQLTDAEPSRLDRFEALYRGEFAFVWSVAHHFGVPAGAVDDVVQDVFVTAYRRLESLRFEVSPRAWLFGVTRRVAFRYRRAAARRARRHGALAEHAGPGVDSPHHRHDHAQLLAQLLARLSHPTREVWQMAELLGMSAPEIASELAVPLNTVYSRLRLAREQLQRFADEATLASWRDDSRRRHDPPERAQQRTWAVLVPALGPGGSSSGAGIVAWIKAQTAMTTTLIATGTLAAGLVLVRPAPPSPRERAPATAAPVAAPAASPRVAPTDPPPPPAITTPPPPDRRLSPRTAPALAPRAALAEEIALIDRVHAQLAGGDAAAALASIGLHAQRFPAGALVDVREAARVDALCKRGDAASAGDAARRLLVDHPTSAVAQRFANFVCPR